MPGGRENKAAGQAAEEFVASLLRSIHQTGVRTQVFFKFDDGSKRIVDVLDSNCGVCYEVKVGKLAKTKTVINQIAKDLVLRDRHGYELEIHFFLSPTTGQGGPTRPLQKYLASNNIATNVHNHTVQDCSGTCKSCRSSLSQIAHAGSANVKDKHSIEAATMESQALYVAGALNLALAVAALALAQYASGRVSEAIQRFEGTKLPKLRQEADRFLAALGSFESALRSEIDLHLHRGLYGDPYARAVHLLDGLSPAGPALELLEPVALLFLVALVLVALLCWCWYWCCSSETVQDKKLKVQKQMMNLQQRYDDFKTEAAEATRELKEAKASSSFAGVLGVMAVGFGSIITAGALSAGIAGGAMLGAFGGVVGGVAVCSALETIERCDRALAPAHQLLHIVQTKYTSVEKTYDVLMGIYQKLEKDLGIPNWVRTVA